MNTEQTEEQSEQTGMGLVIAKNLAMKMGGSIEVQSVEGEDSRFLITIRVKKYL